MEVALPQAWRHFIFLISSRYIPVLVKPNIQENGVKQGTVASKIIL